MRRRAVVAATAVGLATGCLGTTGNRRTAESRGTDSDGTTEESSDGTPTHLAPGATVRDGDRRVTVGGRTPQIDASLYRFAEDVLRVFTTDGWLVLVPVSAAGGDVRALAFELRVGERVRPNPEPFDLAQSVAIDGRPVATAGPTVSDDHWLVFPVERLSNPQTPVVRWTDPEPSVAWRLDGVKTDRLTHDRPAVRVESVSVPDSVERGEPVPVSVTVTNPGSTAVTVRTAFNEPPRGPHRLFGELSPGETRQLRRSLPARTGLDRIRYEFVSATRTEEFSVPLTG